MNPRKIRSATNQSVWLTPLFDETPLKEGIAELQFGEELGEYAVIQGDRLVSVRLQTARQAHALDALLGSGRARIATIDQVVGNGTSFQMTVRFFNGRIVELGDIDIGIDDYAFNSARRLLRTRNADAAEVARVLGNLCALELGQAPDECYFLLTAGAATTGEFDVAAGEKGDASATTEVAVPESERAFCVHGDGIRIAVSRKKITPDETRYLATRLTSSIGSEADGAVRLARGRITFSNFTRTGVVQAIAAGAMAQLMESEKGYLKKWDEYGDEEGRLLLDRARKVGMLRWTHASPLTMGAAGVSFQFAEPLPKALAPGDELETAAEPPAYLQQPDMSWDDYRRRLDEDAKGKGKGGRPPNSRRARWGWSQAG